MKFPRKSLLNALRKVRPAVGKNKTLPVLGYVRIEVKNKVARVDATNLSFGLTTRFPADSEDGLFLAPFGILFRILPILPGDEVEFEQAPNTSNIFMKCGSHWVSLYSLEFDEFPDVFKFPETGTAIDPKFIRSVLFASSTDENRPVLETVYLSGKSGILTAIATDGFRVARNMTEYDNDDFSVLIPAAHLSYMMREKANLSVGKDRRVFIYNDSTMLTTVPVDGNFPNIDFVIPKKTKGSLTVLASEIIPALKSAVLFSRESNYVSVIKTSAGKLAIRSECADIGTIESSVAATCSEEFKFAVNAELLLQGIQRAESKSVSIEWNANNSPIVVKGENKPEWIYVLMPMHIG